MATTLANELLDEIFSDLPKADLLSLIKTHRVFNASAQRHLFRTISIAAQSTTDPAWSKPATKWDPWYWVSKLDQLRRQTSAPGSNDVQSLVPILLPAQQPQVLDANVAARQQTASLLLQAILREPSLAGLIRNVTLDCQWSTPLYINTAATDILSRVGHLDSLSVSIQDRLHGFHWHTIQQVCSTQLWNSFKDVKTTTLVLTSPNLKALSKFLTHSSAEYIVVDTTRTWHEEPGSDIGCWEYVDGEWLPTTFPSNLKSIDLGKFPARPQTIKKILSHAITLRSFSATVRDLWPITPLLPASSNLQELALLEAPRADLTTSHEPSHANFSSLSLSSSRKLLHTTESRGIYGKCWNKVPLVV